MDKVAFFDVDETIINEKSMFTILEYLNSKIDIDAPTHLRKMAEMNADKVCREDINRYYYSIFKGISKKMLEEYVSEFFEKKIKENNGFFINSSVRFLEFLRKMGFKIVFISGSSSIILQPISKHLNVDYVLATEQVTDEKGILTGEISGEPMIGDGKRRAIVAWANKENIELSHCVGMGDHISDFPFLELLGFPIVLSGNQALEHIAQQYNWCVINKGV